MRAFVYTRQSLDKSGEGAAVARQREDCLKLCAERGWDVVREYPENDTSASAKKPRPQYVAMLAAIERGEAEVVVAWHVDRLTRKITDLEHLIELAEKTGLRIVTVNGDLDLSNDSGRLVGRILASVARGEVERKGARQRRAQQQAAEAGRYAGGRRAFGYGVPTGEVRTVNGRERPVYDMDKINEAEAEHLRTAVADLLQGASLKSIAKRWNEAGALTTAGNLWTHSTVRDTIRNPRYCGKRTYRGEVVGPAVWPALIAEEDHLAVVALLSLPGRRTTVSTARKWLLPALALCWKCGSDVATGHTRHGNRVYVCRASKCISRKAPPVDALIEGGTIDGEYVHGVVVERMSRPDAVDLLTTREGPDLAAERARADAIKERLDDLAVGLEEGILTLSAVRQSSERLKAELARVDARINDSAHVDVLGPLANADGIDAVQQVWDTYDLQQRRATINVLMVITLYPPERGHQPFNPESVRIDWR